MAGKSVVEVLKEKQILVEEEEQAISQKRKQLSALAIQIVKKALRNEGWDPEAIQFKLGRIMLGSKKTTLSIKMTPAGYRWSSGTSTYSHPEIIVHFTNSNGDFIDGHVFGGSLRSMIESLTNPSYWEKQKVEP